MYHLLCRGEIEPAHGETVAYKTEAASRLKIRNLWKLAKPAKQYLHANLTKMLVVMPASSVTNGTHPSRSRRTSASTPMVIAPFNSGSRATIEAAQFVSFYISYATSQPSQKPPAKSPNIFQKLLFPPFHDAASFMAALVNYLGLLLPILSAVVGFANIVYQALLKKILDGLGNKIAKMVKGPEPEEII